MNLNKTGLRALIYTTLGLILAATFLLLSAFSSSTIGLLLFFLPEFENDLSMKIGIVALLILSYIFGSKVKVEIVQKHRNKYLITYLYGMLTLLTTSLVYNIVRLATCDNCIESDFDSIFMFFIRPLSIGLIFGLPSILIFGTLFAIQTSKAK